MGRTAWTLAAVLALGGVALVDVAQARDSDEQTKEKIAYFEKYASKARDDTQYADLLFELASSQNPIAAQRVAKVLHKDKDLEHQRIAAAVLAEFTKDPEAAKEAAKAISKAVATAAEEQGSYEDEVVDTAIESAGKLGIPDTIPAISAFLLKTENAFVMITGVRAFGRINDLHALPCLLELFERLPAGFRWETGEVSVDTGAAGTADQDAAVAEFNKKYGHKMKGKQSPKVMLKAYIQEMKKTVHKLTKDDTIARARDLRAWMEARREELAKMGIEIPKYKGPTQKDEDEKKK